MQDSCIARLSELREFVKLPTPWEFEIKDKKERYAWVAEILRKFSYHRLKRKRDRTLVRRYIKKVTNLSKAQLSRLIKKHGTCGMLLPNYSHLRKNGFKKKYGPLEIARLIQTDYCHEHLSGKATREILRREYEVFNHEEYKTISRISSSYIYVIRHGNRQYNSSAAKWIHQTSPTPCPIGLRAKPHPQGRPGFLRVDTVHSGDLNNQKGLYYINIVDEITQWEMIATVPKISEYFLTPVIEEILQLFPFAIYEFHSDNGSEFVNHVVAKLLTKLYIGFTKSRARHSNDNALVESKNGSIIRKLYGHNHIPAGNAPTINEFNRAYVNIYLNYHRPCGFAQEYADSRGKIKKKYNCWMTPYEKLKSLPQAKSYLKEGVTFERLDQIACQKSDNEFAEEMQKAKIEMFKKLRTITFVKELSYVAVDDSPLGLIP